MDLIVAFLSMFLLVFGLSALGLGIFTSYFGAGKSRIIGFLLTGIGIVVLLIFYFMAIDYFDYDWETGDVTDSFLGVLGIVVGAGVSFGLVIILMMLIKEQEPEIPGLADWEKELAAGGLGEEKPEGGISETGEAPEAKEVPPGEVPMGPATDETVGGAEAEEAKTEPGSEDDMSEFLKEKEGKKIVQEDWEKVDEGAPEDSEEEPEEGPEEMPPEEEPPSHEEGPEEMWPEEEPPSPEEGPEEMPPEEGPEEMPPEEEPPSPEEVPEEDAAPREEDSGETGPATSEQPERRGGE